jgi:hypothetical protein
MLIMQKMCILPAMTTRDEKRELWWARLNQSSPRYADWLHCLGSDKVPLKSPGSGQTQLGGERADVHLLDWPALEESAKERLMAFLAKKFQADPKEVRAELDKNGMPIRAEDVTVVFDMRAFLSCGKMIQGRRCRWRAGHSGKCSPLPKPIRTITGKISHWGRVGHRMHLLVAAIPDDAAIELGGFFRVKILSIPNCSPEDGCPVR